MRTNTTSFRKNVYNAVRALGVNCAKSRELACTIASDISNGAYTMMGRTPAFAEINSFEVELELNIGSGYPQAIGVTVNGQRQFGATCNGGEIISVKPTERQVELRNLMEEARRNANRVCADACRAWDAEHGYPDSNEKADQRYEDVNNDPAYMEAKAEYNVLRNESIAINKYVSATIVDPILYGEFSDTYKDVTGSRPGPDWTYEMILNWMDRGNEHLDLAA